MTKHRHDLDAAGRCLPICARCARLDAFERDERPRPRCLCAQRGTDSVLTDAGQASVMCTCSTRAGAPAVANAS